MSESVFTVWAVYDKPSDYPDKVVARKWTVEQVPPTRAGGQLVMYKETATAETIIRETFEQVSEEMHRKGLIGMAPLIGDDPTIIATFV